MGNKKILLIEDDQKVSELVIKRLKKDLKSVEIIAVQDGITATQEAEFHKYDLIITDLQLPRKGGSQVLKRIKFSKYNQDTPLIVITGYPTENLTRDYAPVYLLEKPFKYKELSKACNNLLQIDKRSLRHHHEAFQSFITGIENTLSQINVGIHKISQPSFRQAGDALPGDLQLFFDFEYNRTRMSFDVSAKMDTIHRIYAEFTGGKTLSNDMEIQLAGDELIKMLSYEMTNYFIAQGFAPPIFYKKASQIKTDSPEYSQARSNTGFFIELETSIGPAFIQTLVSPSKGRFVA